MAKIQIPAERLRFVLFTNKNKKEENHPDYNGNIEIGERGKDGKYPVAAWKKKDKNGKPYISGTVDFSKKIESKPKAESVSSEEDDFLS